MRPPPPVGKTININSMARKIDVDDRIPLRNYYRIADNLLKQVPTCFLTTETNYRISFTLHAYFSFIFIF